MSGLPDVVGLCPDPAHTEEFYVPHGGNCPDAHDADEECPSLVVYVRADRLVAERDLLLRRAADGGDRRWVGRSSDAMLVAAIEGTEPTDAPRDAADLARCLVTRRVSPRHLHDAMDRMLVGWCEGLDDAEVSSARDRAASEGPEPDLDRLDLAVLREQNVARRDRWHAADTEPWSIADWSNAMCGEAGEAAGVVKKIRRHETGLGDEAYNTPPRDALDRALAEELADVVLYADLLAAHADVDLALAVRRKFNAVSRSQGFPERV